MIEVVAKLPQRSVYLAGEYLTCEVTFTNVIKTRRDGSPIKCRPIKIAWASAQIHCQCSVSDSKVELHKTPLLTTADVTTTGNDTSFIPSKDEKGHYILSTNQYILFCDVILDGGETRKFTYREKIPVEAPASFRGTAVKYSYKITIGAQRFDCPTKLLRVPFRVLVVPGLNDISVYNEPTEMKPTNPFLRYQQTENNLLDVAMEILQTVTCRRSTNFYNITNTLGKVARFCLFKQAFRIGDDIIGTCDFSEGTIPCVQFSVTLQSEESIAEECRKKSVQSTTVLSYSKHHEFCLHTKKTHISVPIPLTATPGFKTDLVCLKWRLHFEFVTSKKKIPPPEEPSSPSESSSWQGPAEIDVETMVWDLPIKIFATSPIHASTVSVLKTESVVII